MTTLAAVLLTLGVLALAGLLPTLALVGPRVVVLPLLPLTGALVGAVAAVTCVATAWSLLLWFVLWSIAAAALSALVLTRRPGAVRRVLDEVRRGVRPLPAAGAAALVAVVVWTLRGLRVPSVGFDTRAIWLLHAHWLAGGHAFALVAMRNRFLVLAHPGYPPLVSATMALAWRISGTGTDRVAVVTVALLNACALLVAGWGVVEAARLGAHRIHTDFRRQRRAVAAGVVLACLLVLVAGGVLGSFETNGYADPLWSLTAVAVVVFGLVLPPTGGNLGVVAIVAGVAGLTKVEGTAVAMLILCVIGVRLVVRRSATSVPFHAAVAGGVVALLVWPLLTIALDVPTDPNLAGRGQGSLVSRAQHTLSAMTPHLHVVILAALCAVAGSLLLRRQRDRLGLGNDTWGWIALIGASLVLGGAYVFGPGNVQLWLSTSVNRTTIFLALLGWWLVAIWALCGTAEVVG